MKEIVKPLLQWYYQNKRDLPWRKDKDPYHIWLSEIMLQQTRVEAVKGYYERFLRQLPDIKSLSKVSEEELMKLWQGLGYYNRARNLKKAAIMVEETFGGTFPKQWEEIKSLPGIGEYTAGAIASIAFDMRVPAVDGNVYRIYTRLKADKENITETSVKKRIAGEVGNIVPAKDPGGFNQAWMDLGSAICIPNGAPLCDQCPLKSLCKGRKMGIAQELPVKTKKKKRKIEEKTVFFMEYEGKYLIQKRPNKGLLAGLWEFPSQEGKISIEELREQLAQWEEKDISIELLGAKKHIFSHIEWHMLGYLVHLSKIPEQLGEELIFADVDLLKEKYSIPSAFSGYLEKIL